MWANNSQFQEWLREVQYNIYFKDRVTSDPVTAGTIHWTYDRTSNHCILLTYLVKFPFYQMAPNSLFDKGVRIRKKQNIWLLDIHLFDSCHTQI